MTTLTSPIANAKPSDLVFISQTNDLVTDSLKVSEYFGKLHKDVIRKLKDLGCSREFSGRNFTPAHYHDEQGKVRPMYQMTKDGFMFLVMGFTGKRAAEIKERYINAFNEMADQLSKRPAPPALQDGMLKLPNFHYQRILLTVEGGYITNTKILSNEEQFMNTKQFINYFKEPCVQLNQLPQLIELSKAVNERILRLATH